MALTKSVSDKTIKNLLPRSKPYKKFIGVVCTSRFFRTVQNAGATSTASAARRNSCPWRLTTVTLKDDPARC